MRRATISILSLFVITCLSVGQTVQMETLNAEGSFAGYGNQFAVFHSNGYVFIYGQGGVNQTRVNIISEQALIDAAYGSTAEASDRPRTVQLLPAHPNPFNPSTSIEFSLAATDHVQLTVHNMLGQQVKIIQDGLMEAGEHTVNFDGQGLASGVYTYTLQVGSYVETKKFTLVK